MSREVLPTGPPTTKGRPRAWVYRQREYPPKSIDESRGWSRTRRTVTPRTSSRPLLRPRSGTGTRETKRPELSVTHFPVPVPRGKSPYGVQVSIRTSTVPSETSRVLVSPKSLETLLPRLRFDSCLTLHGPSVLDLRRRGSNPEPE